MSSYRHISNATQYGDRVSGEHYINESRPDEQFRIDLNWETMTVHVRVLVGGVGANEWHTVSITPVNATSPARES